MRIRVLSALIPLLLAAALAASVGPAGGVARTLRPARPLAGVVLRGVHGALRRSRRPDVPRPATEASVLAAVRAAQQLRRVPADLTPPLTDTDDIEVLDRGGVCAAGYRWPGVGIDALHFGECTYGDPSGHKLMVIYGDSHAGMWLTALKGVAARTGWRLKAFYLPGCPAPALTFWSRQTGSPDLACNRFRDDAIAAIRALHPAMAIVTSATGGQPVGRGESATASQWQSGLEATLRRLGQPGTQLVVMGDIPVLAEDDATCLAAHLDDVAACTTVPKQAESDLLLGAERAAARAEHARYVATARWECAATCVPIVASMRVYNDQYHLSATYAAYLSGAVQTALGLGEP